MGSICIRQAPAGAMIGGREDSKGGRRTRDGSFTEAVWAVIVEIDPETVEEYPGGSRAE